MIRIYPGCFILSLLLLTLTACDRAPDNAEKIHQHSIFSFGTVIDVSIYGVDEATAEQAFEQLESDFHYMHTTWHPWQRSALSRDNQLFATTEWFSDAPSVRPLLTKAAQLATSSDHLFNPAIGKLIRLWGFKDGEHATGLPPADEDIHKLLQTNPRMDDIEFNGIRIRSKNPDVFVDLGGFAKGYGINRAMESLEMQGIENAVINAGGDLKVIGQRGQRPWRVGINHPRQRNQVMAYVEVAGRQSVFTSGDYERHFEYEGKRYHHIIDPRSGYPATETQSVTVIHADAAVADAAATALFVAGPKDWYRIARSMGIGYVLLVDNDGNMHMSPEMKKQIHLTSKPAKIMISEPLLNQVSDKQP
jgi:thiamine biosynthesis lipoprotein